MKKLRKLPHPEQKKFHEGSSQTIPFSKWFKECDPIASKTSDLINEDSFRAKEDQIADFTHTEIYPMCVFLYETETSYQMQWSFFWNSIYLSKSCGLDSSLTILFFVMLQFDFYCGEFESQIKDFMSYMSRLHFDESRHFWITKVLQRYLSNCQDFDLFECT